MLRKYRSYEKFEGYMPNKPKFVNDNWGASQQVENFHCPCTFASISPNSKSIRFGVQNKLDKASHYGIFVESYDVGKSTV